MTTKAEVIGRVAVATAGRDKGRRFAVIGVADDAHVLLADGDVRKVTHLYKALSALGNDHETDFEEG